LFWQTLPGSGQDSRLRGNDAAFEIAFGSVSAKGSLKNKRAMIPHFQAAFGGVKAKGSLKRVECGRRASARICFALCFV